MKKFYGREQQLQILREEIAWVAAHGSAQLAVITGRRRVGKTELILQAVQSSDAPFVYLFCARISQQQLIADWMKAVGEALGIRFLPQFDRLSQVVEFLLFLGKERSINIAIDECQDIDSVEPSFWSEVQKFWDLGKSDSQVFLMMSGSMTSAMRNIFLKYSEPLYGRADRFIHVRPFTVEEQQEILSDYVPAPEPEDLLALCTLTGGVAWLVEDLMERRAFCLRDMADAAFASGSKFISDGEILLANEFRADANVNRTILQGIASGISKREELQNLVGSTQISGALSRLEKQYELIARHAPLMEQNYRKARYKMTDRYLIFWFSFVQGNQSLLERNDFDAAKKNFLERYEAFSCRALQQCFFEKICSVQCFSLLGSWWDRRGENEIDLIAEDEDALYFFEIKRNPKEINIQELYRKSCAFLEQHPQLKKKKPILRGLSLDDLTRSVKELLEGTAAA